MVARRLHPVVGIVLAAASLAACQSDDRVQSDDRAATAAVVEVITADYTFQAPSEIPAGWTTFWLKNEGREHHFLLMNRLPDGKTFEDYQKEVVTPFDTVWHALKTGAVDKAEAGQMLGSLLPA